MLSVKYFDKITDEIEHECYHYSTVNDLYLKLTKVYTTNEIIEKSDSIY